MKLKFQQIFHSYRLKKYEEWQKEKKQRLKEIQNRCSSSKVVGRGSGAGINGVNSQNQSHNDNWTPGSLSPDETENLLDMDEEQQFALYQKENGAFIWTLHFKSYIK